MSKLPSDIPVKIRVPSNFDATQLAQHHCSRAGDVPLLADRLNWFVSQVISVGLRQDKRKDLENSGYVTLSTAAFDDVFRSRATTNRVIKILDDVVFYRNNSYQTNNYSKGYRLRPEYMRSGLKSVEVTSIQMRKAVRNLWKEKDVERAEKTGTVSELVRFINDPGLRINLAKAHNFLEFWAHDLKKKVQDNSSGLNSDMVQELGYRVMAKIYYQKELLRRIEAGDISYTRDGSGLRLHSSFTGLKSPLRNLLTYHGQELGSVDVKASQPYLLTRLLTPDFWKKSGQNTTSPYTLASLYPELYAGLSRTHLLDSIIMFTESHQTQSGEGLQGFSYPEIPWDLDYYSLLMDQTHLDFSSHGDVVKYYKNRQQTKFYNMLLFFDTKVAGRTTFRIPFQAYFPGVLALMDMIRKIPGLPKMHKGKPVRGVKNNNLPILLQRLESRLILDEICPAILHDYPDLFMLTLHDSIITVKGMEHVVEDYMNRILEKRIGAKPGLKTERLQAANVEREWDQFIQGDWDEMVADMKARMRKSKSRGGLANTDTQEMLRVLSKLGTEPLISNVIPKHGTRQILSTRYVDPETYMDNIWPDEYE